MPVAFSTVAVSSIVPASYSPAAKEQCVMWKMSHNALFW